MGTDEGGGRGRGGGLGHISQVAVRDHFARHLHLKRMLENWRSERQRKNHYTITGLADL